MSCSKTQHLLQEYFADDLAPLAREEIGKHLDECAFCRAELEGLLLTQSSLQNWQQERVPHWDRGLELFRREHQAPGRGGGFWSNWQWVPAAASFAMLCVLLLNVSVVSNERGFSVSFGTQVPAEIEADLAAFRQEQQQQMAALVQRFEDRQDSNNVQLMQAVMEQTQLTTAENLDRIYAYFEQQRLQDLQDMRLGYQELVDSDYETIRSLQQLAQFVSYQGDLR